MDYKSIFFNLRKKKKTKYSMCWIAAMAKNDFIGTGPRKLSKAEIENFNTGSICDEIKRNMTSSKNVCPFKSFRLQSQMTVGALKIFEKQVIFFTEKCIEFIDSVWDYPKKKLTKKRIEKDDEWVDKEIENIDIDVKSLFPKRKDQHLLLEEFQLPYSTSIDFNFDDPPTETSPNPSIEGGPTRFPRALYDLDKTVTPSQTPKRKSRTSHNETPTKRSRKDKDSALAHSKTTESPSIHRSGARSSVPSSPRVRKSLFQQPDIPQESIEANAYQDVQQGPIDDMPQDMRDVPGLPQELTVHEQGIQEGPSDGIPNIADKTVEESVGQNREVNGHQLMTKEISADHLVADNIQRPPSIVEEIRENEEMLQLPEIDDDTIINQRQRKKNRKFIVFDDVIIIDVHANITNPKNIRINSRQSRRAPIQFQKVPAKMLLSLPSVCLKLETNKNKNLCSWGKTNALLFTEMIQSPCPDRMEGAGEGDSPRDRGVNRGRRNTTFTVPEKSTSRTTGDSTKTIEQSVPGIYINADDEPGYQEPMIVPPAPELPLQETHLPGTPDREQQARLLHTPRLDRERHLDSRIAVSPRQPGRPSGAEPPQDEPCPASESPAAAPALEGANFQMPRRSATRTPEGSIVDSPKSESMEFGNYFMTIDEFAKFLENIWIVLRNQNRYEELKFELKDLLVPGESSCEEICVYFVYLCAHAKREELLIKQDELYSTVTIIKLD